MNIFSRYAIFIGLIFLLLGCGSLNDDPTIEKTESEKSNEPKETTLNDGQVEKFFTEFKAATEEVNIYEVDMNIGVEMTQGENKTVQRAQLFGVLEESMGNLDVTAIETRDLNKNEVHIYKADTDVYIKENDSKWIKETDASNEYSQSDTSYNNIANSLDGVNGLVEVVETVDMYEVTYTGKGSNDIFKAFEKPFNLTMTGIDIEKESEMDLLFMIDKESKFINSILFEITAEKDGADFMLKVDIEYDNINDTIVEIPEEVIEEAS